MFDNRGDGKIQQQQIAECLRALGQNPTEADVKKFTHQLKSDDRISFEVFLPIYQVRKIKYFRVAKLTNKYSRRFLSNVQRTLLTISLKGFVTSIKMRAVSFHRLNYAIC